MTTRRARGSLLWFVVTRWGLAILVLAASCSDNPPGPGSEQPLKANAGPDLLVSDEDRSGAETVTLDGSASAVPEGQNVAFLWREGADSLAGARTAQVSFTAGLHIVTLLVQDHEGHSSLDTVVVSVSRCAYGADTSVDYLLSLGCVIDFEGMSGTPLIQVYGDAKSVKFTYLLAESTVYFVNSRKWNVHYDFCRTVLGYPKDHATFNNEQYAQGPSRLYILGDVTRFRGTSDIYAVTFFAGDLLSAEQVKTVYRAVLERVGFTERLKYLPTSPQQRALAETIGDAVPIVSEDSVFAGQTFQPLNRAEAYGYLVKVELSKVTSTYFGRHDIVLVNGVPNDLPAVAGLITTELQTPLSHMNVLSQNRGTPNMALKTAWRDAGLTALVGKLVHFVVRADTFVVREASLDSAQAFWTRKEPYKPVRLDCNDTTPGLLDISQVAHRSVPLVGAKAANLGELTQIRTTNLPPVPVPEGAFAVPFFYYRQHVTRLGLDFAISSMLRDTTFRLDMGVRKRRLKALRDSILAGPVDTSLLRAVSQRIRSGATFPAMRFRSSTNAEDLKGFNGAGLYESFTGSLNDAKQPVSEAITKVWASLWNFEAYEEREYFRIDHQSAAMGILVHRSYPAEAANGVAITANIYSEGLPGFTINVQAGDISVVKPPAGFTCDQLIFYTMDLADPFTNPTIEYLTHSNINGGKAVLSQAEVVLLARYLDRIKQHFYGIYADPYQLPGSFAMDVEFKFDGPGRVLYIKQARPY